MIRKLRTLKLWFWWMHVIKKNEFHPSLSTYDLLNAKPKEGLRSVQSILAYRRALAHELDIDSSIKNIHLLANSNVFKGAKL